MKVRLTPESGAYTFPQVHRAWAYTAYDSKGNPVYQGTVRCIMQATAYALARNELAALAVSWSAMRVDAQ